MKREDKIKIIKEHCDFSSDGNYYFAGEKEFAAIQDDLECESTFGDYKCHVPTNVKDSKGRTVHVDKCLKKAIEILNAHGIKTIASCCGHGKINPSIIIELESPPDSKEEIYCTCIGEGWTMKNGIETCRNCLKTINPKYTPDKNNGEQPDKAEEILKKVGLKFDLEIEKIAMITAMKQYHTNKREENKEEKSEPDNFFQVQPTTYNESQEQPDKAEEKSLSISQILKPYIQKYEGLHYVSPRDAEKAMHDFAASERRELLITFGNWLIETGFMEPRNVEVLIDDIYLSNK